jgi:uncharacterized protein YndB with AHSA1/START domain
MTQRSVTHSTFTIERDFDASPADVFNAYADVDAKKQWFGGSGDLELDFSVGGREYTAGEHDGTTYAYEAAYRNIVPDERIVFTYEMWMNGESISVSVGTVELTPTVAGTRLVYTEQGAFLDGLDTAEQREHGTAAQLDVLREIFAGTRA